MTERRLRALVEVGGIAHDRAEARAAAAVLVTGQPSHTISDTLADLRSAALLSKPFSIDQPRSVVDAVRQVLAKPNEAARRL